jgi:hypothetical protein
MRIGQTGDDGFPGQIIECFSVMERIVGPLFRGEKRMEKQISLPRGGRFIELPPLSGLAAINLNFTDL